MKCKILCVRVAAQEHGDGSIRRSIIQQILFRVPVHIRQRCDASRSQRLTLFNRAHDIWRQLCGMSRGLYADARCLTNLPKSRGYFGCG